MLKNGNGNPAGVKSAKRAGPSLKFKSFKRARTKSERARLNNSGLCTSLVVTQHVGEYYVALC